MFAHKTVGQVADHFDDVIGKLTTQARDHRALVRRPAHADPRRARPVGRVGGHRPRARSAACCRCPISALKSASPVLGNPANHGRAVPLTYEQFRFAFANAVTEDEAHELYNTFAVPARERRCSRRRPPTSTRGPRRR